MIINNALKLRLLVYSVVLVVAFIVAYVNLKVLEGGGLTIFDFFFYEPFPYFFQSLQFVCLISVHFKYFDGDLDLMQLPKVVVLLIIEVLISSFVLLYYAMLVHTSLGGSI